MSGWVIVDNGKLLFLSDENIAALSGLLVATSHHDDWYFVHLDTTDLVGSYCKCASDGLSTIRVQLPVDDEERCRAIYAKFERMRHYSSTGDDIGMRILHHFIDDMGATTTSNIGVIRGVLKSY